MLDMKNKNEERMQQAKNKSQKNNCLLMVMGQGMNQLIMMNLGMPMNSVTQKNGQNEYKEYNEKTGLNNAKIQFNPFMNMMSIMFNQSNMNKNS